MKAASIIATEKQIDLSVVLGNGVELVCDRLFLGKNVRIGDNTKILSPEIRVEEGGAISSNTEIELNDYFRMGRHSSIGSRVAIAGRGFECGEFLWMKNGVVVGGGGNKGPRSFIKIGNETTIVDGCFLNISEEIEIGNSVALSKNVSLLTHAAWQPALEGFATKFGPIRIGDHSVVYLNSSVMPGVTLGSHVTIGASSLVTHDVPSRCLAAGVPAEIKKGPENYPKSLSENEKISLIEEIVSDYVTTLEPKGVSLGAGQLIFIKAPETKASARPDITLSFVNLSESQRGRCHFDLATLQMHGEPTALSEDFRDYLRRRAIRFQTGTPFRTLPLSNLARLKKMKKAAS